MIIKQIKNTISWNDFIMKPRYTPTSTCFREVENADEIVTLVKSMSNIIGELSIGKINFVGCSEDYVREKITLLENDIKWLKKRVREVSKL